MRIIKETHIDFMSKTVLGILLSALLIVIGVASIIMKGGPKLSIDFKGGTMIAVNYTEPVDINEVRSALNQVNIDGQTFDFSKAEIKHFGDESNVAVRLPSMDDEPEQFAHKFVAKMMEAFPSLIPDDKSKVIFPPKDAPGPPPLMCRLDRQQPSLEEVSGRQAPTYQHERAPQWSSRAPSGLAG